MSRTAQLLFVRYAWAHVLLARNPKIVFVGVAAQHPEYVKLCILVTLAQCCRLCRTSPSHCLVAITALVITSSTACVMALSVQKAFASSGTAYLDRRELQTPAMFVEGYQLAHTIAILAYPLRHGLQSSGLSYPSLDSHSTA